MSLTRREFLVTVPVAGTAFVMMPSLAIKNAPVVSFHLDQPYLDITGLEKPYVPPVGMRSGASLSEEEVFSRFYGFI